MIKIMNGETMIDNRFFETSEKTNKLDRVKLALLCMVKHQWEHGTAAQAFIESGDTNLAILMAHDAIFRQTDDGRLAGIHGSFNITDPCACGEPVIFAYEKTGDWKYKVAAKRMLEFIKNAPASSEGIQYHNYSSNMIAADCMYMVPPFYAAMGEYTDAIRQVDLRFNLLWNEEQGAITHQYDDTTKTFSRDVIWGAASGWNAAGIVRVLGMLPENMSEDKKGLSVYLNKIVAGMLKYQLDDGLFHDILDDESTFVETTAAMMLAYSIYRGVNMGFLDGNFIESAEKIHSTAMLKVDELGLVQGCAGAPKFNFYGVSPEGQAFYILMEAARMDCLSID